MRQRKQVVYIEKHRSDATQLGCVRRLHPLAIRQMEFTLDKGSA